MTRRGGLAAWSPPVVVAVALPALLAVAVAVLAVAGRFGAFEPEIVIETGPLAVAPVDAPAAGGPECASLLTALPAALDGDPPRQGRAVVPAAAGVRAWAETPRPVVLRCGLPRPVELTPTSALLQVNGVSWLTLDDGVPDPVVQTHVAVDRSVYVAVTVPTAAGAGPLQEISDVLVATVVARPVEVR